MPLTALAVLRAHQINLMPDEILAATVEAGVVLEAIDTGDPGVTHDISTAFDALPDYQGPAEPGAGTPPEWGAAAADMPDDAPLAGPALAPYSHASEDSG